MITSFFAQIQIPVPRDLALPLPMAEGTLKILLVLFFLMHILFVNLMVGGSLLTFYFELWGLKKKEYDSLAREIAATVTVNKSLAVVLGIGPLLCISLVYTSQFYSANVLTGHVWWLLVPLVTAAFILTYLHKYTWDAMPGKLKGLHLLISLSANVIFLLIPLIFLSNINLMLFPEKWSEVRGFLSSLQIGNVIPRYFHFLIASHAVCAFFLVGYFGRKGYPVAEKLSGFTHAGLKRIFYKVAYFTTLSQFLVGPIVLFTLPQRGLSAGVFGAILSGAGIGLVLLFLLFSEVSAEDDKIGRLYWPTAVIFTIVVLFMGTGRHLYREASLSHQTKLIERRTDEFRQRELKIQQELAGGMSTDEPVKELSGETLFKQFCSACHMSGNVLVGPSLEEVIADYEGNPEGIVEWAKAPGRKRTDYPQMQPMANVGEENLKKIADYILSLGQSNMSKEGE